MLAAIGSDSASSDSLVQAIGRYPVMKLLVAIFASLCLTGAAEATQEEWTLPSNLEWHTRDKQCDLSGAAAPFMKGCYFGSSRSAVNLGAAFFRVCARNDSSMYREPLPFLVVDFENESMAFDDDVDGKHLRRVPLANGSVEPEDYFREVNGRVGSCWFEKPNLLL
jgi:hypothetical protein